MGEDDLTSEQYWYKQKEIPGSTRIPVAEIKRQLDSRPKRIADLGSGSGRSTKLIREAFPDSKVVAFDLCTEGLKATDSSIAFKVQGTVLELPFKSESFDAAILCGVMTNITDEDPKKAIAARKNVAKEVARILAPGGVVAVSDFSSVHELSNYPVSYRRHALITGEHGTIAVFDPAANISFVGKSDAEVSSLAKSSKLQRIAHHYSYRELIGIFMTAGLRPVSYSIELGTTPSGTSIDTLTASFKKE